MKLSAILEDEENIVMVPLCWLTREDRQFFIQKGYEVIPIPGYRETDGYRAFKIIGPYSNTNWWIKEISMPIWEDWKLTAQYASRVERCDTTSGQKMFDRLDDAEKIQSLRHYWYSITRNYIIEYFRDQPDLLKRAKNSLKREEIHDQFKDLFR